MKYDVGIRLDAIINKLDYLIGELEKNKKEEKEAKKDGIKKFKESTGDIK